MIQYLVSAMSPFSNVNPIFAVNVVKISQDSWFYFTKQVSFWMRDDSLWANGAKVWLYISGSFWCDQLQSEPSLSARSLCSTVACRWIPPSPFKTSMLWTGPAKPWPRYQRYPKIIILGHGKGDSRQISPVKNINSLLSAAISIFWRRSCKVSTRLMSCNMFGAWWAFIATCHSQTHPPSMSQWLSTLRHPAQAPRCSHQELCINGVPSGVGPTRL